MWQIWSQNSEEKKKKNFYSLVHFILESDPTWAVLNWPRGTINPEVKSLCRLLHLQVQ